MRLVLLALKNFKAFHGQHVIELPDGGPGRPVHLFGGMNGAGKTSVTQAFALALHGLRAADLPGLFPGGRDARPRYEQWLSAALNQHARSAGDAQMQVRVVLDTGDALLTVTRTWWFNATGAFDEELLQARSEHLGETELLTGAEAQALVDDRFPRNLLDFAIFDGEQVRQLDDTLSSQAVRIALDRLLELEPVDRLRQDLLRAAAERRARNADPVQRRAYEALRRGLDEAFETRDLLAAAVDAGGRNVVRLEADADRVAAAVRAQLRGRQSSTSLTDEQALVGQRRELQVRLGRLVADGLYLLPALPDALTTAVTELGAQRQHLRSAERAKLELETIESIIEEASRDTVLQKRLGPKFSALEEWLANNLTGRRDAVDAAGPGPHGDALADFSDAELVDAEAAAASALTRDLTEAQALARDLLAIDDQLEALVEDDSISSDGDEQLELLLRRRDELNVLRGEQAAQNEASTEALAAADADISQRRAQIARLEQRLDLVADDVLWAQAAERAAEALSQFVQARRSEAVGGVRVRMLAGLQQLLRKQDLVADVTIDPISMAIRLINGEGSEVELPSAAEHQLAAMAFSEAVLAASSSPLPVFVDTPLARLDSTHRAAVVSRFWPTLGRQIIVLSTDEEVVGDLHVLSEPHLASSHLLVNGPDSRTSVLADQYLPVSSAGAKGELR